MQTTSNSWYIFMKMRWKHCKSKTKIIIKLNSKLPQVIVLLVVKQKLCPQIRHYQNNHQMHVEQKFKLPQIGHVGFSLHHFMIIMLVWFAPIVQLPQYQIPKKEQAAIWNGEVISMHKIDFNLIFNPISLLAIKSVATATEKKMMKTAPFLI